MEVWETVGSGLLVLHVLWATVDTQAQQWSLKDRNATGKPHQHFLSCCISSVCIVYVLTSFPVSFMYFSSRCTFLIFNPAKNYVSTQLT